MAPARVRRLLVALVLALACLFAAAAARPASPILLRAWITNAQLHATYHLPRGMQPYGMTFWSPHASGGFMMLLSGGGDGVATQTSFVATSLTTTAMLTSTGGSAIVYNARLLYGRAGACGGSASWNSTHMSWNMMLRCPHRQSNAVKVTVGNLIGPGSLRGASSASGDFADATVSGNVNSPNILTVRVSSVPSGQSVHIAWDLTCTKGSNVKGASGSWDDSTPVNDGTSINVPYASITSSSDSCTYAIGASLEGSPGSGTITVRVYVDKTHL